MEKYSPITIGIIAHVDAGKTTLAEKIFELTTANDGLHQSNESLLDTNQIEKRRGITIYSKVARFQVNNQPYILVDTPGHVDFGPEMERALELMDIAVLLISAPDGVVGYTKTLWSLLGKHRIPTIVFVNKTDQMGGETASLEEQIRETLSERIIPFEDSKKRNEEIAMLNEDLLDKYLATGQVEIEKVARLFNRREIFPLLYGAAIHGNGVQDLIDLIDGYREAKVWPEELSLRVYKTNYEDGVKLNHIRLLGGQLQTKDVVEDEKVHEIRKYNGSEYEIVQDLQAGDIGTLIGPLNLRAGQVIGDETPDEDKDIQAVINYEFERTDGGDSFALYQELKRLEEEFPDMALHREEESGRIFVRLMGDIQLQVLNERLEDQGIQVRFNIGGVIYRETIKEPSVGLGHYEPLKHYAEVRLLLEPGPVNSGITFSSDVSTDHLAIQWQKQVQRITNEVAVPGVLTGSKLTDIHIRLIDGRAHNKHTAGGDFLQASVRALRNGLMRGQSILLEPYYEFELDVPLTYSGKILQDFERLGIQDRTAETATDRFKSAGRGPVSTLQDYFQQLPSLTKGTGRVNYRLTSYQEVENPQTIIEEISYNPLEDEVFSPHSIFYGNGSAILVPWDEVEDYAHTPPYQEDGEMEDEEVKPIQPRIRDNFISDKDVDRIFQQTFYANANVKKKERQEEQRIERPKEKAWAGTEKEKVSGPSYLLIDGYNVIYALPPLRELAEESMDAARSLCIDELAKYQAYVDDQIIVVFDAYRVKNYRETVERYGNLVVIYTKLAETADQYIQKVSKEYSKNYQVTVATSDMAEQRIVWGDGAIVRSAEALWEEIFARIKQEEDRYRKTVAPSLKQGISIDEKEVGGRDDE